MVLGPQLSDVVGETFPGDLSLEAVELDPLLNLSQIAVVSAPEVDS
jgi:hypothetical protein